MQKIKSVLFAQFHLVCYHAFMEYETTFDEYPANHISNKKLEVFL